MRTLIDIDCGDLAPACGFECGLCVQEIGETLEGLDGVHRVAQNLDNHIVVDHDPAKVGAEDFLKAMATLPSRLEGTFRATIVESGPEEEG